MKGLGEAAMIAWATVGLKIEKTQENQDAVLLYVSVPERSYRRNARNEEMAGMTLAKRFKETMLEMGVKRLVVKARIRQGEMWTEKMGRDAAMEMEKMIFGNKN